MGSIVLGSKFMATKKEFTLMQIYIFSDCFKELLKSTESQVNKMM